LFLDALHCYSLNTIIANRYLVHIVNWKKIKNGYSKLHYSLLPFYFPVNNNNNNPIPTTIITTRTYTQQTMDDSGLSIGKPVHNLRDHIKRLFLKTKNSSFGETGFDMEFNVMYLFLSLFCLLMFFLLLLYS
jgi:hypothetical protein